MTDKGREVVKLVALGGAIGVALGLLIPAWAAERVLYLILTLATVGVTVWFVVEATSPGWWRENFGAGKGRR